MAKVNSVVSMRKNGKNIKKFSLPFITLESEYIKVKVEEVRDKGESKVFVEMID